MSVGSEITRLYGVRSDIFSAIEAKGVTVPSGSQLDDCPALIAQINTISPLPPIASANTLRIRYTWGFTPSAHGGTLTQVSSDFNIWDWTRNNYSWNSSWAGDTYLLEVVDASSDLTTVTTTAQLFAECSRLKKVCALNLSAVNSTSQMFASCDRLNEVGQITTSSSLTNTYSMFNGCSYLTSMNAFDTSHVTNMYQMFLGCSRLTYVPLFNTSSATNVDYMFNSCPLVAGGALALYQQMSSQTNVPSSHSRTFTGCGSNTTTGAAELAQIPSDWK